MTSIVPSTTLIRDIYARMLLTRLVDDSTWKLYEQGYIDCVVSCRGHEAAQVGSALCIEIGNDFTLPYYRDLGVVLTIGMTPYEVFRTYLQSYQQRSGAAGSAEKQQPIQHWGYHKHNIVTGPAPVATQLLHAAGIAFASKLRKTSVVTVAYCGDGATAEPDFREGIRFAAQHRLPVVFICEQDGLRFGAETPSTIAGTNELPLPEGLTHQRIDGVDVVAVYTAMCTAMQHAREGYGPTLLEMYVTRLTPQLKPCAHTHRPDEEINDCALCYLERSDPLMRCQHYLQEHGAWDEEWATQLETRISTEVERALHDAMRDTLSATR